MQFLDQIPDGVKVVGAVTAPVLTFIGIPVEQWGYALSAIVALFVVVEKLPVFINRCKTLYRWIKGML